MSRAARTSERGAVVPIIALLLPVLLVMTAFAVDLGRQRANRRDMQAVADVVALDLSRLANGRTLAEIQTGDASFPAAETALQASADRNEVDRSHLTMDWGTWDETTGFVSANGVGTAVPDAVLVTATQVTDYYFQPGEGRSTREAVGVYGDDPYAGFSVGSFAATMDTSTAQILDDLLSPYIDDTNPSEVDAPVELDAASYQALAGIDLTLGDLAAQFAANTPRELLDMQVTLEELMVATATVLRNSGRTAEADLVEGSITAAMGGLAIGFSDWVSAATGTEGSALAARVDLPVIIAMSVFQAQCGTSPSGFEECTGLAVPTLTATVPLTSATGSAKVIESERYHFGPVGTGTATSQLQTALLAETTNQHVGDCVPTAENLLCVLDGLLVEIVDATVTVDATITSAGGRTDISQIGCADPSALTLDLASATDLYDVQLDVTVRFGARDSLTGLIGTYFGTLQLDGDTSQSGTADGVQFLVPPDILGETTYTTGDPVLGLGDLSLTSVGSTDVLNDLAYLNIDFDLGDVVGVLVNPVLDDMNDRVLAPLSDLLGMNVAGSDLVAYDIECDPGFVHLAQ